MKKEIYSDISRAAGLLFDRGYSEGFGGNVSVRIDGTDLNMLDCCRDYKPRKLDMALDLNPLNNDVIIITTTGSRMYQVRDNPVDKTTIIFIEQGNAFLMKENEPSSELKCHIGIYSVCSDFSSIVHTHPPYSTALCARYSGIKDLNSVLKKAHGEFDIVFPRGIGFVENRKPGSEQLSSDIISAFREYSTVLMRRHGIISGSTDIFKAFDNIDIIEKCASIAILSNNSSI
ncbi:MAG: class II aldolase/adducin family protein [bacterium]